MKLIPIYVIKMPGSIRNLELLATLKKLGLNYEIQDAVVGNNLTELAINARVNIRSCDARLGKRINRSLIGCGLSHLEIYKKAFLNEYDWILVLEEDVEFTNFNINTINEILNICGDQPIIIQLFSRSSRLMKRNSIIDVQSTVLYDFDSRIVGWGASAYLMNKKAIEIAISEEKLTGPPDWPRWAQAVQFKGVYPWMFNESQAGSTIPFVEINKIKYMLRRISQLTGMHYYFYRKEYGNFSKYLKEEIYPYALYLLWKFKGSKFFQNDPKGPQII